MSWDSEIRTVRDLLRAIASGGRLVHSHHWRLDEENQWKQYRVVDRAGRQRAVRTSIAVAALRKQLVQVSETEK